MNSNINTTSQLASFFKPTNNAANTMLMHRLKYWPEAELSAHAKSLIRTKYTALISKASFLQMWDQESNTVAMPIPYKVVWAYNNQPTEQEWMKIDLMHKLGIELRCVPALANYRKESSTICILSYKYF